ncbi:MAG: enoyl-CoA hydratase-related protein [Spirochaetota bacterium]|nr:enoyl-CoA hydratase-related protein [Spirochaetota bacterium]
MSQDDLLYNIKDRVAYLTINREEKRNAINENVMDLIIESLERAEKDNDVRVVCLTGFGEKAFCSGGDLGGGGSGSPEDAQRGQKKFAHMLKKMDKFPKPIVGRINGYCMAGGLGLMLSCDIAIAHEDVKFGTPEVNVGLFPMMIGALILRDVGRKKAMQMVLTGERIIASEAEKIGLISEAVPKDKFDERVDEVLQGLSKKSPIIIKLGKEAFNQVSSMGFDDAVDLLCDALGKVIATDDAKEGVIAFLEKREPNFTGK